jgi:hypothetical protein
VEGGGSVGSWRRRARKASEYAIAGLCGPTRQSFKPANRTCSEVVTRDENGTDTVGYRVISYPFLMYFSRIWDRIRVVKIRDGTG